MKLCRLSLSSRRFFSENIDVIYIEQISKKGFCEALLLAGSICVKKALIPSSTVFIFLLTYRI